MTETQHTDAGIARELQTLHDLLPRHAGLGEFSATARMWLRLAIERLSRASVGQQVRLKRRMHGLHPGGYTTYVEAGAVGIIFSSHNEETVCDYKIDFAGTVVSARVDDFEVMP